MPALRSQCVACLDRIVFDDGAWRTFDSTTGSYACDGRDRAHEPFDFDLGPGTPPGGVRGPVRLCWAVVSWARDSAPGNAVTITVDPDGVTYVDVEVETTARVFVNGIERHAAPF